MNMKLLIFLCALVQFSSVSCTIANPLEVCYDGYGCYTTAPPFTNILARRIGLIPLRPEQVGTKFSLYTRMNQNESIQITAQNESQFFIPKTKTRFIVHGFLDFGTKPWILDMKDTLLRTEDVNVIVVDWSRGNKFPYSQASANTQIVGADIAILVNAYIKKGLITSDDVHIIGHSLGAHIAGYAGERIPNLGRITGLDPAGPFFENTDPRVRLDPTDAKFVDAIHTDGSANIQLGFGMMQPVGHVDFYVNGGKEQPKCAKTSIKLLAAVFNLALFDFNGVEDSIACSHMSAVHFYTDTIEKRDCTFQAYPCKNYDDFLSGKCMTCSSNGCNHMGHYASAANDLGSLYLTTQDVSKKSYCLIHYKLNATSNTFDNLFVLGKGKISVSLTGSKGTSAELVINKGETLLDPGSVLESIAAIDKDIGTIQSAKVSFTKTKCVILCFGLIDHWGIKTLEVVNAQEQTTTRLCSSQDIIKSGESVTFNLC